MGQVTWRGATAMVTGASRGIGRAVAGAAAERGAGVGLVARSAGDLESVRQEITAAGGRAAVATADVGEREAMFAAVRALEVELGPTDVVVADAGIGAYGPFADVDLDDVERIFRVNVLGTVHVIRAVLPGMIERRTGHVVVVGSIAGRVGAPFEAVYSATKFAQAGLTEALAVELAPFGIGVSMVNPGVVATDFFRARGHAYDRPFPRPIPPERVAAAVIRAVEKGRLEQVVPGWLRPAVAVRHLVPSLYEAGTRRSFRRELAAEAASRPR